jgi:hypothetical protein
MKNLYPHALAVTLLLASFSFASASETQTDSNSGKVLVQSVTGDVKLIDENGTKTVLTKDTYLGGGVAIETGVNGAADLMLQYNGTALRLTAGSKLQFSKLSRQQSGEDVITETSLKLLSGAIIGSQRKLNGPSSFNIEIPGGVATIKGTEYVVRADGAVTVLSGVVRVNFNLPGNGGSVRVNITAGNSFNPATGQVIATTPNYLQNLVAEVETVRNNARVFKTGGATVVVQPEKDNQMSPVKGPKGNNGVGNGIDPQPPGNPPINDGPGTGPGNPGNQGGGKGKAKGK